MHRPAAFVLLLSPLGLLSCAAEWSKPEAPALPASLPAKSEPLAKWWTQLGSPQLDALVEEAMAKNLDVAIALTKIAEDGGAIDAIVAASLPSLDAGGGVTRKQRSANVNGADQGPPISNTWNAALKFSYETDVSALNLRSRKAMAHDLLRADTYLAAATRAALSGRVVRAVFAAGAARKQCEQLRLAIASYDESLKIRQRQLDIGAASPLELQRIEAEAARLRSSLPALEQAGEQALHLLAFLLGRDLGDTRLAEQVAAIDFERISSPLPPPELAADLLQRRPDVLAAEAQLDLAANEVNAVRSRYYPRISLLGGIGFEADRSGRLFDSDSKTWSGGIGVSQALLGLFAVAADEDRAIARRERGALLYRQTAFRAWQEARSSLSACTAGSRRVSALQERVAALRAQLASLEKRRDLGAAGSLEVRVAERELIDAEINLVQARTDAAISRSEAILALGGAW
ncbi:MAG: hypothetical protein RL095_811 [Verrucomicrobiota bacterium]|jgi:NodT family efflux transporter outer membrane factor (OMF) lipoprotein